MSGCFFLKRPTSCWIAWTVPEPQPRRVQHLPRGLRFASFLQHVTMFTPLGMVLTLLWLSVLYDPFVQDLGSSKRSRT